MLVLEDVHALEVQSYVPDELYAALRVGEEIPFTSGDATYRGRLESKVESADVQTHTHLIRIAVSGGAALMSGRYVRVSIPTGRQPQVRIPTSALSVRAGISGVFVVDADDRAWFRLVRVGVRVGGSVEIKSGLTGGERIVLAPSAQVDNGTRIVAGAAGAS
jgi:membrane fusion protein, multidrug efflux system